MAEILFGQSYFLRFDPKLWRLMQPYAPLGTLIAAAHVRRQGYDVALFDAMLGESEEEWNEAVRRQRPRFAVLYEDNFNYLSKMCLSRMREAACAMIEMARAQGCTVIICGSDASDRPEIYLDHGADYVLLGEGEITLTELLDRLTGRNERPLETIPGLAMRNGDGGPLRTVGRPVIRDLDALPFPAWDLVDVKRYRRLWREHHGTFSMNMVTTRGCPFHCNWCAKPIWGQTYHMRSPANAAAELAWLKRHYRPDHIWFADDIIALKRGWMAEFADAVEERDAVVPFKALSRVDLLLREGEVESLRRAGAQSIWVGAESGSQRILDAMDKGTRVEQIHEASRRLRDAGIGVGFFLQFGYPGERWPEIRETLRMVRDCRPDEIGMSVSYPLPGTEFHRLVDEQLGSKRNWVDSEDLDMMFAGTFTTEFYRQLYIVLHKEFRVRGLLRQLPARLVRPWRLRSRHLYEIGAMGYHLATLPAARLRLWRLRSTPGRGIDSVDSGMTPGQAAVPTPQGD